MAFALFLQCNFLVTPNFFWFLYLTNHKILSSRFLSCDSCQEKSRVNNLIEGFPAKRTYIAFRADFYFCRIELSFGGLTCVAMKSIIV